MKEAPIKPYTEERPWGNFVKFTENIPSTVKIITVKAEQAFSLQFHKNREEFWHIISGTGTVTIGTDQLQIAPGQDYFVPKDTQHRVLASTEIVMLEIALGQFDENDIVRIEDRYGRIK